MKIFLIYGGKSAEHDVSILTAFSITKEIYYKYYDVEPIYITKSGKWLQGMTLESPVINADALKFEEADEAVLAIKEGAISTGVEISPTSIKQEDAVIFPVLHGPNGEDGTIQGLFEVIGMPYVGAGVLASACGMDKIISKYLFQQAGLPQVPYVPVLKNNWSTDAEKVFMQCEGTLLYPMFVKPANMGSSVGISKAENREELIEAIEEALKYDRRIVVEQGIEARELEVAVLGNSDIHTSVPGEIVKTVDFYDYDSKYINNEVTLQIPAKVTEDVSIRLREYAARAFQTLDGSGLSRCDFFLTSNDEIFINEVNTMPGFTQFSMYPLLWENTGLGYGDLVEELIQLALRRFEERQAFQYSEES
ncbi:D-alanine--D-alanine ligase A [Carnobacterium divergens]|uniref:D-alanine--D-alanine ligase n=1 Tax=Carnobacterium divergens TaxID=2748 RepID=UPI001071866C|nr:D-alanine--D-alanine ligase [Carnobacterium divergens]TFJ42794.1 D-alanine--D-alanine ligase A [Carnobacterium divergens]TFJ51334.1 D-alanine--D-alanine ligase A [Carnobacterium divergens]TFJ56331.1 D-alanine--D-alanine ligase A [Carnobacterium divergens]TFJ63868.1 D-alanine--D-alanine ligase A [Carnobacterium divergens]TFJ73026.1 D-alanine--D-alanine ligase A [Carnobacterium divergens]